MQSLHISADDVHDWLCDDDEYARLLIPANETDSELIVCVFTFFLFVAVHLFDPSELLQWLFDGDSTRTLYWYHYYLIIITIIYYYYRIVIKASTTPLFSTLKVLTFTDA